VLSGRGLCDELITRPEESYRLWCVVVCDLENLKNEEAMTRVGSQRHSKKIKITYVATCKSAGFKTKHKYLSYLNMKISTTKYILLVFPITLIVSPF